MYEIASGAVLAIVWLVRLEGRINHVEKIQEIHTALFSEVIKVKESLARIEGRLGIDQK